MNYGNYIPEECQLIKNGAIGLNNMRVVFDGRIYIKSELIEGFENDLLVGPRVFLANNKLSCCLLFESSQFDNNFVQYATRETPDEIMAIIKCYLAALNSGIDSLEMMSKDSFNTFLNRRPEILSSYDHSISGTWKSPTQAGWKVQANIEFPSNAFFEEDIFYGSNTVFSTAAPEHGDWLALAPITKDDEYGWQAGYRPQKIRLTFTGPTRLITIIVADGEGNHILYNHNAHLSADGGSGGENDLDFSNGEDIAGLFLYSVGNLQDPIALSNIEFYWEALGIPIHTPSDQEIQGGVDVFLACVNADAIYWKYSDVVGSDFQLYDPNAKPYVEYDGHENVQYYSVRGEEESDIQESQYTFIESGGGGGDA
ncbi:hypothetical protein QUF75_02065 [Desulfococcaceae bacterium HSG7]|nr:hypothetical protein [Desulfococcaceae bacterium HSG7]